MKSFLKISSVVFLMTVISSCSMFTKNKSSISIALPGYSNGRSITSGGDDRSNEYLQHYEVRVRNSAGKMVQKKSGLIPGTIVNIDELYPDTYMVSILGYRYCDDVDIPFDKVEKYGAETIKVNSGETTEASISLGSFESDTGTYPFLTILPANESDFYTGSFNYSCTVTGYGLNFTYSNDSETAYSGKSSISMHPEKIVGRGDQQWNFIKEYMLERNLAYTFNVTVKITNGDDVRVYHGTTTTTVKANFNTQSDDDKQINIYLK